jgi:hypothetical protein
MKSEESSSSQVHKSQSSQTDFSVLSLLEKLRQKDLEIQKLQKELSHFKHRNLSLNDDISKILQQTPSNPKDLRPEKSKLHQSQDSHSKFMQKFTVKHPLDTATIEELDTFTGKPSVRPSLDTPEPKAFSKLPRKRFSNEKSKYSKNSKLSLKAKQRLNKNTSIISDLVYQDGQDMETWTSLLNKFREDPNLIKQALHINEERTRNSVSVEPVQIRTRVASAYKSRKASHEPECRPISAMKGKYRPITAKVQDIDWSKSVIDSLVARGQAEFPSGDNFFSNSDVEEILLNKASYSLDEIFDKAGKTLEKLKTELLLPRHFMQVSLKNEESLEKILRFCIELFRARALVVKILKLIHLREDVMLKLIASDELNIEGEFENMERLGQEILQIIAFLKHAKFPIGSFVYLGEDYALKIQKDNESIVSLYPSLKSREVFASFNL